MVWPRRLTSLIMETEKKHFIKRTRCNAIAEIMIEEINGEIMKTVKEFATLTGTIGVSW